MRNRIRLALLPELESGYNGNIVEALVRLASNAAEDREYFDEIAGELLEKGRFTADGAFEMPLDPVARAHTALRRRLIVRCFERVGLAQDIAAVHLHAADALIESGRTGKTVDFPNGYRLSLRYGRLLFFAADKAPPPAAIRDRFLPFSAFSADAGGAEEKDGDRDFITEAGAYTVKISLHPAPLGDRAPLSPQASSAPPATAAFDFELLARAHDGLSVRGRRAGDRIRPEGMDGAKSVQDLFVDAKLPRESRDAVPLVAAGSEILCVLAAGRLGRKTSDYAITSATKWILLVEYMKQM
jgi:tRNA(Ile)-lysidine synthase